MKWAFAWLFLLAPRAPRTARTSIVVSACTKRTSTSTRSPIRRVLEEDMDSLNQTDQARYAYLRGMTDFRLKFRLSARYWLGIAKAIEREHGGGLSVEWQERLKVTLDELNQDVYGGAERFSGGESTFVERSTDAPGSEPSPDFFGDSAATPASTTP